MQRNNASSFLRTDVEKRWRDTANRALLGDGGESGADVDEITDSAGTSPSFLERSFLLGTGAALRPVKKDHNPMPTYWSPKTDFPALLNLVTGSAINVLLILVPIAYIAGLFHWSPTLVFVLNFISIIPLALILGDVTEDLALRCGDVIGGLVNATFGNVVDLILSCVALSKKSKALDEVAGMTNLGSVLSNLLLVLGCCFLFGGLLSGRKVQTFNSVANRVSNSLLFLAVIGVLLPSAAPLLPQAAGGDGKSRENSFDILSYSRIVSVLLLTVYIVYLYFQLVSHNALFAAETEEENQAQEEPGTSLQIEEEDEQPALTVTAELSILFAISIIVAIASEFITDSIDGMAEGSGLSTRFLSLVLLPLAGNAVEHITAVVVAIKNKMDLALAIAIGSSIQIAIFVLPTCVLFAWGVGNSTFTLALDPLGIMSLAVAIVHANFITSGGKSHYLMGVQLICTYLVISAAFLF